MAFIDGTVVNVALPALQSALNATVTDVQWVIEAYSLLLSALLLVGGSLGDHYGRRRVFLIGVALFAFASLVEVRAQTESCTLCEAFVGAIEKELANNSTESEIITLVDKLCAAVPSFKEACDEAVKAGVPQVIVWIQEHENNTVVCGQLGLCKAANAGQAVSRPRASPEECAACKEGIQVVEEFLERNSTVVEIEDLIEGVICKIIPNIESTCDAITEAGVPKVIEWIQEHENATIVCQQLKVCTTLISLPKIPAFLPGFALPAGKNRMNYRP